MTHDPYLLARSALGSFHKAFATESDRAAVILVAAMLDDALRRAIQSRLVPCANSKDALFDDATSPLSTFSARIDFAYRVGVISKGFCRDLHIIRRIRNDFAHQVIGCNFENSVVHGRIDTLSQSFAKFLADERWATVRGPGPRGVVEGIGGFMIYHLNAILHDTETIREAREEWGYSPLPSTAENP